jgi:hypothetical protein
LRFGGGPGGGDLGDPLLHDGGVGPGLQGGPEEPAVELGRVRRGLGDDRRLLVVGLEKAASLLRV